jgi:hypothetical protein
MRLPQARQDKLTVRQLPDETLVYDHLTKKAHCLNQTAGLVWKHCDGNTTVAELSVMLHRELDVPASEALVYLTLEKLARRKLLETVPDVRRGRRDMLRKLAVAALPFIMTVAAPRANAAASKPACPGGQVMCNGTCVTPKAGGASCSAGCQCTVGLCSSQASCCTGTIPSGGSCLEASTCITQCCLLGLVSSCNGGVCVCQ